MGGGLAVDDQPVAGSRGPIDGASMDVAAGHRDATGDLLLDQLEIGGLDQPGGDAVVGEGVELGVGVGGVAVALHNRQVLVVAIGARKRAGLEGLQEHGAAGRKVDAIALAQLGGIALLEIGHTPQGVGMAATAGPQRGRAAPRHRAMVAWPAWGKCTRTPLLPYGAAAVPPRWARRGLRKAAAPPAPAPAPIAPAPPAPAPPAAGSG